jgi:hypothetical protein
MLFQRIRLVAHIDIQPHKPGNPEDIDEINGQKSAKQTKCPGLAPTQKPVKKRYKQQTKPPGPDIGNEHRAIIIAGFREVIEVALGAAVQHVERPYKRPTPGFKQIAFVATRAFQVKDAVAFGAFFE